MSIATGFLALGHFIINTPMITSQPNYLYGGGLLPRSGIIFAMVGGKAGSGYRAFASSMVDELDARGIASEFIDDEPFHMAKPYTQCELCRQRGMTKPCRDCPHSLDNTSFFHTIRETHAEVTASSRYVRDQDEHFPQLTVLAISQGRS